MEKFQERVFLQLCGSPRLETIVWWITSALKSYFWCISYKDVDISCSALQNWYFPYYCQKFKWSFRWSKIMILLLYPVNTFLSQTRRTQTVLTFCPVTLFHRNEKVQFSLNSLLFSSLLSQNSEVFVNLKKAEMTGFFYCGSVDGFSHACPPPLTEKC